MSDEEEYDLPRKHWLWPINQPLSMLDVAIGTTVVRTEHCYRCAEDTVHESTYVEPNTWSSDCTKRRPPGRQKTSEPHRSWSR